jgi:hypothetical protein
VHATSRKVLEMVKREPPRFATTLARLFVEERAARPIAPKHLAPNRCRDVSTAPARNFFLNTATLPFTTAVLAHLVGNLGAFAVPRRRIGDRVFPLFELGYERPHRLHVQVR